VREQVLERDRGVDQREVAAKDRSSRRGQLDQPVDDEADDDEGRHPLHRAGDPELRVDVVRHRERAVRQPVRPLQSRAVAIVDANDAGEIRFGGHPIDLGLQRRHRGTVPNVGAGLMVVCVMRGWTMTYGRWMRIALGYLAVVSLHIGVWAELAPRSFFDDYPGLGRPWVRVDGPYNEHLVRDVGGLNLALAALLIVAFVTLSRPTVIAAGLAALLWGVPHLVYHIAHTDRLGNADIAISIGGLVLFAVVGIALIVLANRTSPAASQ
jgi:hypothetical protein